MSKRFGLTSYKYIHNGRIDKAKEVVAVKTERTIGDAFRT
jgi:hypothetical protein